MGIDLGGTKISAVALDADGAIRAERRVPTPGAYDELLAALARLVVELETEVGPLRGIGVGTPGGRSPITGLMQNAHNTALQGRPFDHDLERVLGRPIRLANDAACFALSEATDGAGAGAGIVFGVIVGTGTGGGVVVGGKPLTGANAIGCEWGHNPLPWSGPGDGAGGGGGGDGAPGPPCTCGKHGCIETYLSGPGLSRDHEARTGEALSAVTIAHRSDEGDPACGLTIDRYADRMARALASVINLLDPDVIVLGGGLSRIDALYTMVPARWSRYVATETPVATRLVRNRHGDASGVRGAAWLWPTAR